MSYPPLNGYGSYYDSQPNQNAPPFYDSNRQSSNPSYGQQYRQDEPQTQYGSSGYDWQVQGQPNYPSMQHQNRDRRDAQEQTTQQQDYKRDGSNFTTQATADSSTQGFLTSSNASRPGQNLQGLNNLAYASCLDHQRGTNSRPQQPSSSSKYSMTPNPYVNRVQSPLQEPQQQQYSSARPTTFASHDASSNAITSPQLAISAAQALAGAVGRRYGPKGGTVQRSASPVVVNGPSTTSVRRASSRDVSSANVQGQGQTQGPSSQSHAKPAQQIVQPRASPVHTKQQPSSTSKNRNTGHGRGSNLAEKPAASQSSSISNLVSTTKEATPTLTETVGEAMPTYIDPAQVFNPYHREHEERRKEAARAEARRQEQEATETKAREEQKCKDDVAAKAALKKPVTKTKTKTKVAAPKSTSPEEVEDIMAVEMKAMMEKMKEFRSKDPATFQKLWDDMRKGSSGAASAASAAPPVTGKLQPSQVTPSPAPETSVSAALVSEVSAPPDKPKRPPRSAKPPLAATMYPGVQANGYKVVVENNEEGLPDLGRFPAERRICGPNVEKNPKSTSMPGPVDGSFQSTGLAQSSKKASGGSEWPKEKRHALAVAAVEGLKADTRNHTVTLTVSEILEMLEQNPSYVDLCTMLESTGVKFHRGQLARHLLVSVPDLTTPQKQGDSESPATPLPAPSVIQQPLPSVQSSVTEAQGLAAHTPVPQAGFMHALPTPVQGQKQSQERRPTTLPGAYGVSSPAIKPEYSVMPMQTQVVKSKKAVPAKPEPPLGSKEAMARKRDFSELVDLTQVSDNEDYVLSNKHPRIDSPSPEPDKFASYQLQQAGPSSNFGMVEGVPLKFDPLQPQHPQQSHPPHQSAQPPPQRTRTILARPLDKSEALRKSYYDPKTVARDILIAAGRHPTERPLNAHLAGLLIMHVDLESDLTTFDWNAVDPGGPPPPKVEFVDIPAGPPRFQLGDYVQRRGPASRDKRPRLPDGEKREVGDIATSNKFKSNSNVKPRISSDHLVGSRAKPSISKLRQSQTVDQSPSPSPGSRALRSSSHQTMEGNATQEGQGSSVKRRGRPPGSKNKHMPLATMKKLSSLRPPQPLIEIPAPASASQPVFRCRWKGCKTDLHNLGTLRRHIFRMHEPSEEEVQDVQYVCWWKSCPLLERKGDMITAGHQFTTVETWQAHIENEHLYKVAMKLGDGPSSAQTDPQLLLQNKSRYLNDAQGKIITPSVSYETNADLPKDTLELTQAKGKHHENDLAAQKKFLKVHRPNESGPKVAAEELLRAMEKRKELIGPGLDRGGCTLVNVKRRETFAQSPGIWRVIGIND